MRLKSSKALSLVSLATKAGKTASGEFCTEKEVKTGMAELVIVAEDASANTKKKFKNMCDFYEVPIYFYGDKDTLGHAMGDCLIADDTVDFADAMIKLSNDLELQKMLVHWLMTK